MQCAQKCGIKTKQQLSEMAELAINTVYCACKGKNINRESAEAIARVLQQDLDELFEAHNGNRKLSDKTIRDYHRLISSILNKAVRWQRLLINPCTRVDPPRVQHQESRYMDDVETGLMLGYLDEEPPPFQVMISILLFTGVRRGELFGLEWEDIDFEKGIMKICRSSQYLPDRGVYTDTLKTYYSNRVIKVSATVLHLLEKHQAWQDDQREMLGDQWTETDRLFTQWNGTPMRPDTLTHSFSEFIKKHTDLPSVCLHSLRHTHATLLIAENVNLKTVSARLGHSSIDTTLKIYTHSIQTADAAAAEALDVLLGNLKDRTKKDDNQD